MCAGGLLTCILNRSRCVLAGCRYLQGISGESLLWSNQYWCVCWRVIILFFTRENVYWRETSWLNDWICVLAGATSQWGNEYVWWQARLRKKKAKCVLAGSSAGTMLQSRTQPWRTRIYPNSTHLNVGRFQLRVTFVNNNKVFAGFTNERKFQITNVL